MPNHRFSFHTFAKLLPKSTANDVQPTVSRLQAPQVGYWWSLQPTNSRLYSRAASLNG